MMNNIHKCFVCLLLAVFLFSSACSAEDIYGFLVKSIDYETVISAEFTNDDDIGKFERRLEALSFDILSKNQDGNVIEYRLQSHYKMYSEDWSLLSAYHDVCILGDEDKAIIDPSDIEKVEFDGTCLYVHIYAETYASLDEYDVFRSKFRIDSEIIEVMHVVTEGANYIRFTEVSNDGEVETSRSNLIKFAVSCASEPLTDVVTISLIESKKI